MAAIKSRYFMIFSCKSFRESSATRTRRAELFRKNQARGGGTGGRSARTEAIASRVNTVSSISAGREKVSKGEQKSTKAEHGTGQQRLGREGSLAQLALGSATFSFICMHFVVSMQQLGFAGTEVTFGLPTAGQRKMLRQTISNALIAALRITLRLYIHRE
jgi:hypothetical protein